MLARSESQVIERYEIETDWGKPFPTWLLFTTLAYSSPPPKFTFSPFFALFLSLLCTHSPYEEKQRREYQLGLTPKLLS